MPPSAGGDQQQQQKPTRTTPFLFFFLPPLFFSMRSLLAAPADSFCEERRSATPHSTRSVSPFLARCQLRSSSSFISCPSAFLFPSFSPPLFLLSPGNNWQITIDFFADSNFYISFFLSQFDQERTAAFDSRDLERGLLIIKKESNAQFVGSTRLLVERNELRRSQRTNEPTYMYNCTSCATKDFSMFHD